MTKLFTVSLTDIKSALVSGFLMALIAMIGYILSVGDIFGIDIRSLTNIGVMALLTSLVSIIKNLLTTKSGAFIGAVSIK